MSSRKRPRAEVPVPGPTTSDEALVPASVLSLARSALGKQARGETPTDAERRAIERYRRAREARDRQRAFATVTKTELCALAERQPKVLNEMAQRYELPIGIGRGRVTDLNGLVKRLFDILAMHGTRLLAPERVDACGDTCRATGASRPVKCHRGCCRAPAVCR